MEKAMSTNQAALVLGVSHHTLKHSRVTGKLGGHPAPKFRKVGRKVIYFAKDLQEWIEKFMPAYGNTAEVGIGEVA